jgi:hypothetical protein
MASKEIWRNKRRLKMAGWRKQRKLLAAASAALSESGKACAENRKHRQHKMAHL